MAEVKFKVGDKVKCVNSIGATGLEEGREYTIINIFESYTDLGNLILINNCGKECSYFSYRFEKVEDNMTKTFKQVINDIKEGEIWVSNNKKISYNNFRIVIKDKVGGKSVFIFDNDDEYTLQRQQYTFEEAFKAYEEGKEIESVELIKRRYKKIDDIDKYYNDISERWFVAYSNIDMQEIRGKWYINN